MQNERCAKSIRCMNRPLGGSNISYQGSCKSINRPRFLAAKSTRFRSLRERWMLQVIPQLCEKAASHFDARD